MEIQSTNHIIRLQDLDYRTQCRKEEDSRNCSEVDARLTKNETRKGGWKWKESTVKRTKNTRWEKPWLKTCPLSGFRSEPRGSAKWRWRQTQLVMILSDKRRSVLKTQWVIRARMIEPTSAQGQLKLMKAAPSSQSRHSNLMISTQGHYVINVNVWVKTQGEAWANTQQPHWSK